LRARLGVRRSFKVIGGELRLLSGIHANARGNHRKEKLWHLGRSHDLKMQGNWGVEPRFCHKHATKCCIELNLAYQHHHSHR
jgi:hypothetical protein